MIHLQVEDAKNVIDFGLTFCVNCKVLEYLGHWVHTTNPAA